MKDSYLWVTHPVGLFCKYGEGRKNVFNVGALTLESAVGPVIGCEKHEQEWERKKKKRLKFHQN